MNYLARAVCRIKIVLSFGYSGLTFFLFLVLGIPSPSVSAFQDRGKNVGGKTTNADLPDADVVIKKFTDALGGDMHLGELTNYVLKGRMDLDGSLTVSFELIVEGNKFLIVTRMGEKIEVKNGSDGKSHWMIDQEGTAIVRDADDINWLSASIGLDAVDWNSTFASIKCISMEKLADGRAYCLEFKTEKGDKLHRFFDVESGLLVRTNVIPVDSKQKTRTTKYTDYKIADDYLLPHTWTMGSTAGIVTSYKIVSFETGVDLPADQFKIPEKVRALLKEQ